MDIHHAMIIRNTLPDRLYGALTQVRDLEVWMGAPTLARPEVGSTIEFQFDQGQRILKMEVTRLEVGEVVEWRVIQPVWPIDEVNQIITWTLIPYECSTLVDFRMNGWPQDDDVYASVSYKWASFMMRLKLYMGDTRELATFLPTDLQ
jgi:uncharacterized protein YndB with AHSA1/START domain